MYLTLRGYHSFDGDQAYRLPLLLHRQEPELYAGDPFVTAFDDFNPHRGSLLFLEALTRPLGLSMGLFALFVLTFGATCFGLERLARAAWPEAGPSVGLLAIGLVLAAKAGNIGTNHLFEAMVLDRLIAFALGWIALAEVINSPDRGRTAAIVAIALACLVHPSAGLQLAMLLGASWIVWGTLGRWTGVTPRLAVLGTAGLAMAVIPGLLVNLVSRASLMGGMPADTFWLLSVELQSPQHMLPHLWRMPQWLAFASYLALAGLALLQNGSAGRTVCEQQDSHDAARGAPWPQARLRLAISLAIILASLAAAWFLIEAHHHVRVTVFQPFRMATMARGIALVLLAGRLVALWRHGSWLDRLRVLVLGVAVAGDWLMFEVTLAELAVAVVQATRSRLGLSVRWQFVDAVVYGIMLARGAYFLGHHDTEYGHFPLLCSVALGACAGFARQRDMSNYVRRGWDWACGRWRLAGIFALAWAVPLLALVVAGFIGNPAAENNPLVQSLINRCRLIEVPTDDIERLALWCRDHTPRSARFIGPPGPKTFRLWSRRSVAFNRAASPYHAAGLEDWFARFQEHVNLHAPPAEFVRAYVANRHGFEARYQGLSDVQRAALAVRQGATYVIAAAPPRGHKAGKTSQQSCPLELLHIQGQYAVYRVKPVALVQRHS
jgi:hypothetical protein